MFNRYNMFFSPIQYLSTLVVRFLVRRLGVHNLAVTAISLLFNASVQSVRNVGLAPTVRVLLALRRVISTGSTPEIFGLTQQSPNLSSVLNSIALQTILESTVPHWTTILKHNRIGFGLVYDFFLFGFSCFLVKPLSFIIVRVLGGMILGSIGISLNDSLNCLSYLRDFSNYILGKLEFYTNFRIPSNTVHVRRISTVEPLELLQDNKIPVVDKIESVNSKSDSVVTSEKVADTGSALFILGTILAGLGGVVVVLLTVDHLNHDLLANTPVVSQVLDSIHIAWDSILNLFSSRGTGGDPDPVINGVDITDFDPNAISRSNSSGSSIATTNEFL